MKASLPTGWRPPRAWQSNPRRPSVEPSHEILQLATTDPSPLILTITSVEPRGPVAKAPTPLPGLPTVTAPPPTQTILSPGRATQGLYVMESPLEIVKVFDDRWPGDANDRSRGDSPPQPSRTMEIAARKRGRMRIKGSTPRREGCSRRPRTRRRPSAIVPASIGHPYGDRGRAMDSCRVPPPRGCLLGRI